MGGQTVGRPAKTNVNDILTRAEALIDASGEAALSLRGLARALDLTAPSVLAHVGDLAALRDRLRVRAAAELAQAIEEEDDGIAGVMNAWRGYATDRPGRYALIAESPKALTSARMVQAVCLRLGDADRFRALAAISALHGLATLQAAGGLGTPASADAVAVRLLPPRQVDAWPANAPTATPPPPRAAPEGFRTPRLRLGGRS
jgi:AcrR family transcriptional regulator